MRKEDLRIVFMGTPEFAVASLRTLVENGYNVVGVVTMPDKPAGRGHKVQFSAIKQYAMEVGLKLLQPKNLKDEIFLNDLQSLQADLQIVVAFRMLPEKVWAMPAKGTFNLHASLLPQYRGAAPINWAIINGEEITGATTFFLKHEIDTGAVILQCELPIDPDDDAGSVHDKLMVLGAQMVIDTVNLILDTRVESIPQDKMLSEIELKSAPKIFKETCELSFDKTVDEAYNFVRGLSPYPAAWVTLSIADKDFVLKLFKAKTEKATHSLLPGTLVIESGKEAKVALKDGFLHLLEVQAAGKRRMTIRDFLNGLK